MTLDLDRDRVATTTRLAMLAAEDMPSLEFSYGSWTFDGKSCDLKLIVLAWLCARGFCGSDGLTFAVFNRDGVDQPVYAFGSAVAAQMYDDAFCKTLEKLCQRSDVQLEVETTVRRLLG